MKNQELAYVIIKLLADDQNIIPYRPPIARVYREAGHRAPVNVTIFLQQVVYWWAREWPGHPSFMPFYKFNMPCPDHPAYVPGQSWIEELELTERELLSARGKISLKKRQGVPLTQALRLAANPKGEKLPKPIIYWTTTARRTYYTICPQAILYILTLAYPHQDVELLQTQDIKLTDKTSVRKPTKRQLCNRQNVGYNTTETTAETSREHTTTTECC